MQNFKNITNHLLILQINDALFPIGSYTQSYGLETYVQKNLVYNPPTFKQYLIQNLEHNLLYTDILAAKLSYDAAKSGLFDEIIKLDTILSATKVAKETRLASTKLSSRFIKTIRALDLKFNNQCFIKYTDYINENLCLGHYAISYGILCGSLNLDQYQALLHFSYAQVSSIINNGVKLIPLSQTVGQALLCETQAHIESILQKLAHLTREDLGRSSPGFELRSMQHENLYSRLYMS